MVWIRFSWLSRPYKFQWWDFVNTVMSCKIISEGVDVMMNKISERNFVNKLEVRRSFHWRSFLAPVLLNILIHPRVKVIVPTLCISTNMKTNCHLMQFCARSTMKNKFRQNISWHLTETSWCACVWYILWNFVPAFCEAAWCHVTSIIEILRVISGRVISSFRTAQKTLSNTFLHSCHCVK
jgi:hypothetical protein